MFKSLVAFVLSLSSQFSCAQMMDHSSHSKDSPSVHGMAMVGTKKVYLSHLPMFHSPHDYQALLEVSLSQEGLDTYLESKSGSTETLYTLVPEIFVLPDMIGHPKPFKASIYKGHFERGGQEIVANVTVTISKVLYFKKFNPQEKQATTSQYILFGNSSEQFAAHLITAKPDFDHLLSVTVPPALAQQIALENHVVVSVEGKKNQDPWQAPEVLNGEIEVKESLYLEHGDLSH
ncbi:hypothetical protein [Bdellovibrio sp. HCB337]|uniref:hypothetical protein n=1 Tax=Bdellovibrio sp. HCB337 TaxID=3394358 RepID=UPI0039A6B778